MPHPRSYLVLLTVTLLAACGDDGPTDPGGGGGGNGDDPVVLDDPSFSNDIMEIFTRKGCTAGNCHGGGAGGLTMGDASTTHGNLVDVTSPTSGEVRVIPGDAPGSYLVVKLEPDPPFGVQMPNGGAPLDDIDMTNIRNWIAQGAQNN